MRIAVFDSGLGGITVLKEAVKLLPQENYAYFSDTKHVPYGVKPKEEVKQYIFEAVEFLSGQGIKALVLACNTATSIAVEELRTRYAFPVIGMEPAVKPAVNKTDTSGKRVLVFATALTLRETKFQHLVTQVDQHHIVDYLALPELVEFAEALTFDESVIIPCLKKKLASFDLSQYGTVVLGCTHYPFFLNSFRQVLPHDVDIIDGISGTVRQLKRRLEENRIAGGGSGDIAFFSSGDTARDQERLRAAYQVAQNL